LLGDEREPSFLNRPPELSGDLVFRRRGRFRGCKHGRHPYFAAPELIDAERTVGGIMPVVMLGLGVGENPAFIVSKHHSGV
jgi:hypothetical protein